MFKKGFTLIELLIVITIIGILSGIVLASIDTAINKANDSSIKGSLIALKSDAIIAIQSNNTTFNICDTGKLNNYINIAAAGGYSNYVCIQENNNHFSKWAIVIELKLELDTGEREFYCLDGNGSVEIKPRASVPLASSGNDIGFSGDSDFFVDEYLCR